MQPVAVWPKAADLALLLLARMRLMSQHGASADCWAQATFDQNRCLLQAQTADKLGIDWDSYRRMRKVGMPRLLFEILARFALHRCRNQRLHAAEFFCGAATIATAFNTHDYPAIGLDIVCNPLYHDITLSSGFLYALWVVLSLKPNGLAWFATVCSTWVFLSRNSTGRSASEPLGRTHFEQVDNGNIQTGRSSLLALLTMCLGSFWALEQPASSLMFCHPGFAYIRHVASFFDWAPWYHVRTYMGAFSALTSKPTDLAGNGAWLCMLAQEMPSIRSAGGLVDVQRVGGRNMVTGRPKQLKQTQTYTAEFGLAVWSSWVASASAPSNIIDLEEPDLPEPVGVWDTVGLEGILKFMESEP